MNNEGLSCFFPTTVVLIEDDSYFIDVLSRKLIDIQNITLKAFLSPIEGLNYVNEVCSINRLDCSDLIKSGEENTSDCVSILVNINRLHREIYSMDRFSRISVVVSDYSFPEMNGSELCSKVSDPNIQKILLTGVADEKIAIAAFNKGYINHFIKKESSRLDMEITESINESIRRYFQAHTDNVCKYLSVYDRIRFRDPVFINFFLDVFSSGSSVEYYMLDSLGGYLFLTAKGEASLLCVMTEHETDRIISIGEESGELSSEILTKLKAKEYMLVSHDRYGKLPPISEWEKYLRPARMFRGYQTYYFSLAGADVLDLDFKNIKSFEQFRNFLPL
ncbi:MAG: hypothetical protein LBF57_04190 [Holosporaceae bacterium]|jgi:CheY-like chemotaxis protein|nr:hypothetical protein [Holosporaceae bacterium]